MTNNAKLNRRGVEIPPSEENYKPTKAKSIEELLEKSSSNQTITDSIIKAWSKINSSKYKKILCSISGGSDSDIMLDLLWRCDINNKIEYVWFDTGLEYQATKDHIKFLESKYDISIISHKAQKPIPISCKQYGQPFLSKYVSQKIWYLQKLNFSWIDLPFEELCKTWPKYLMKWWCNQYQPINSQYNIARNKWLKEFLIAYAPTFSISAECCEYAKKKVSSSIMKESNFDMKCIGIRKYEGGIRATIYKNCFDGDGSNSYDNFRPIFWYTNLDKADYENIFHIIHSRCYTEYGLIRTGCSGCPFEKKFEEELKIIGQYEPKLYIAANNIFKDSYEYTRKYREFCKRMNEENGQES